MLDERSECVRARVTPPGTAPMLSLLTAPCTNITCCKHDDDQVCETKKARGNAKLGYSVALNDREILLGRVERRKKGSRGSVVRRALATASDRDPEFLGSLPFMSHFRSVPHEGALESLRGLRAGMHA